MTHISRRDFVTLTTAGAVGTPFLLDKALARAAAPLTEQGAPRARPAAEPFGYCLNTSTIRGNNLDIVAVVNAASKAGFHAIEPWISEIDSLHLEGRHARAICASGSRTRG